MKRLYLPVKYRQMALHIWCSKCKTVVTAKPCKHYDRQRFQSRIYNPFTKKQDCIRSYETRDSEQAVTFHRVFLDQLKATDYNVIVQPDAIVDASKTKLVFLSDAVKRYLDYLQDIGVPEQEKKNLTPDYVKDQTRYIMRFIKLVKRKENTISNFPVNAVHTDHVTDFYKFLKKEDYAQRTYNAHMQGVKYFFNYVIKDLKIAMANPLERVKMPEVHYDPEIIPVEEFEQFLSAITPKSGMGIKGSNGIHKVNYYRPWLKKVFVLSLLIGERLDGVVLLKWSHIEGNFFKIPNFKVNRIQKVDKYYSYTPITADLAELLLQFEMTRDEDYIVAPEHVSRYSLKKFVSKAFTHYWRVAGLKRKVSFKNLRKTYETRLTSAIGAQAMFVKHTDDKTAMKHYLAKDELLKATKDVRLYDISSWL
jgi:hypothetical protein